MKEKLNPTADISKYISKNKSQVNERKIILLKMFLIRMHLSLKQIVICHLQFKSIQVKIFSSEFFSWVHPDIVSCDGINFKQPLTAGWKIRFWKPTSSCHSALLTLPARQRSRVFLSMNRQHGRGLKCITVLIAADRYAVNDWRTTED